MANDRPKPRSIAELLAGVRPSRPEHRPYNQRQFMKQFGLKEGHCGPLSAIWLRMRMTQQNPDFNAYLLTTPG
jgi:hypothetical protein